MFEENNENTELEKTKELEELRDLNNQIVEVNENIETTEEEIKEEKPAEEFFTKPTKVKLKDKIIAWWNNRTKKQKILMIVGTVLFLILIIVGITFLVRALTKKPEVEPPKEVIVQEDNYRYENGALIFLNNNKEEIGRYTCENQNEELCFVSYYSTEDDFDVETKVYQNNSLILTRSAIIDNTYVFINDNSRKEDKKIKLYNMKDQTISGTYALVKKADKNKVIVKNESDKYGVIEIANNEVLTKLDFAYDYLGYTINEKNAYISKQNGRNFIVDETGRNLSKAITGTIKNLNGSYIKVKVDQDKYEVYNYNNQNVFGESFDYVELFSDYAVLINDTKMYLRFYDKNKLNEDPIQLNNKEYIKTSIYDENNTLVETKEAFAIEENNEIITITIKTNTEDTTVAINKAEGILNKKLRNINYFDGKLYIYSNNDKTSLLGTYTCSNKNNVESGTTSLNNCTLASDTVFEDNDYEIPGSVGTIPVFNERFIFISDNPDLVNDSSKTIVLYDLKKNTSLGKYSEVNTYSYTGTKDITFSTVTDLQVVAKNQSGNFGVIKINLTEVTGHIGFNYREMEKLRDYYVAKDANGYVLLPKNNDNSGSGTITYKIRNYNSNKKYVKVINNGNYYIYDYNNKQITNTGYKYIELYDNFFAGVDSDNQLGIYTYEDPTKNKLNGELIQLQINKYYGNGTLAFKISGNEILIGTSSNTYLPIENKINLQNE